MFANFFRELKEQMLAVKAALRTREFWIYAAVIQVCVLAFVGFVRLAAGFDPLTRSQLRVGFSCRTGEGQMATIIAGGFVFVVLCVFTIGQIVFWLEETRRLRAKGRERYSVSYLRPLLHVIATVLAGLSGYWLLLSWCT